MAGSQLKERLLRVINRLDRYSGLMSAVASVVIAILVVQYSRYSKEQWDVMRQQLDFSQRQLELSQRPWIEFKAESNSDLVFKDGRWNLAIKGMLLNHGESVALNIGSWMEMFPYNEAKFAPAIKRQLEWCNANRRPSVPVADTHLLTRDPYPHFLFPGESSLLTTSVGIRGKDISAQTTGLVVMGCVYYHASYDPKDRDTRQTRFAYLLSISDTDAVMGVPKSKDPIKMFLVKLPRLWIAD
jgi:hypothetical protein